MALRIDPRAHVEDDPARAFLMAALIGKLHSQLRLADARGPDHHGQRAGNQSAAQAVVQSLDAGR